MLSISDPLSAGSAGYYVDYYQKHTKAQGIWAGQGAQKLKLGKEVQDSQFHSLLRGYHPVTGKPLVQNAGRKRRQGAWDLTFSAPKSVSVLWSLLPENERAFIEKAHTEAVKETLKKLEEITGYTRRGKQGTTIEKADLVFAIFNDYTSRAHNPQIHAHALLFNVGVIKNGATGALRSEDFFDLKMALGAHYRVLLAKNLTQNRSLEMEADLVGFRIKGVPQDFCEQSSRRRREILSELTRMGKSDAVSAKKAALKTRRTAKNARLENLFPVWQEEGKRQAFGPTEALHLFTRERKLEQNKEAPSPAPEIEKTKSNDGKFTRADVNEAIKKAEQDAASGRIPTEQFVSFLKLLAQQFFHIREHALIVPTGVNFRSRKVIETKKVKIPYLAFGPKPKYWGRIRRRLFEGRYGELRIQSKMLFPHAPSLSPVYHWSLPAIRWYRYTKEERLEKKSDRWEVRPGAKPNREGGQSENKSNRNTQKEPGRPNDRHL